MDKHSFSALEMFRRWDADDTKYLEALRSKLNDEVAADEYCIEMLKNILYLLNRRYFTRLWPLQEITPEWKGDRVIHYGQYSMDMLEFEDSCNALWNGSIDWDFDVIHEVESAILHSNFFRARHLEHKAKYDPIWTLFETFGLGASDPRDQSFAMSSLFNTQEVGKLFAGLHYGLSAQTFWIELNRQTLTSNQTLYNEKEMYQACYRCPSVMLAASSMQRRINPEHQPSWATDFGNLDCNTRQKFLNYQPLPADPLKPWPSDRPSTGKHDSIFTVSSCPGIDDCISIPTLRFSEITTIVENSQYDVIPFIANRERDTAALTYWFFLCLKFVKLHSTFQSWQLWYQFDQFLLQRHVTRSFYNSHPFLPYEQFCTFFEEWLGFKLDPAGDNTRTVHYSMDNLWSDHKNGGFQLGDSSRVLASTAADHVGWVPPDSKIGNIVCIFRGAMYPFVVREASDGYYTVVGDAWIDGIMGGEAWPDDDRDGVEMLKFR